jgi:hypothetical protein
MQVSRILADGPKNDFAVFRNQWLTDDAHSLSAEKSRYLALQLHACLWHHRLGCRLACGAQISMPTQRVTRSEHVSHVLSLTDPLTMLFLERLVVLGCCVSSDSRRDTRMLVRRHVLFRLQFWLPPMRRNEAADKDAE